MLQTKTQSTVGIQTKYLGATNTKGARIKAFTLNECPSTGKLDKAFRHDTVTLLYDYALSGSAVYEPAMRKLHEKINHNPKVNKYQQKECTHVAISSWTKGGYFFVFGQGGNND